MFRVVGPSSDFFFTPEAAAFLEPNLTFMISDRLKVRRCRKPGMQGLNLVAGSSH